MDVILHYDMLIDESNDPFRDPEPLKEYMDKYDGQEFIDSMNLTKDTLALEIGVGTGRIACKTAPLCKELYGIDISPKTVDRAKENLIPFDNIKLICADFLKYDFNITFDVIYSSLTSMHFEDKKAFIKKAYDLLNCNGLFALSINKSNDDYIDMGDRKLRIYPDTPQKITHCINSVGMSTNKQFETEFSHIFICRKK